MALVILSAVAVSTAVAWMRPPQPTAFAAVAFQPPAWGPAIADAIAPAYYHSYNRLVLTDDYLDSHHGAEDVLRATGEVTDETDPIERALALQFFSDRLWLEGMPQAPFRPGFDEPPGEFVILIAYDGPTEAMAMAGLQRVLDIIVELSVDPIVDMSIRAHAFLEDETERLRAALLEADRQRLLRIVDETQPMPAAFDVELELYVARMSALLQAEKQLASGQRRLERMGTRLTGYDLTAGRLRREIESAERVLSELRRTYAGAHPAVRAQQSTLRRLRARLEVRQGIEGDIDLRELGHLSTEELRDAFGAGVAEYFVLESQNTQTRHEIVSLREQLVEIEVQLNALAGAHEDGQRLDREVERAEADYRESLDRYLDSILVRDFALQLHRQFDVLDPPQLVRSRLKSPFNPGLTGGLLAGFLGCLLLLTIREYANPAVRTPDEAGYLAGVAVITTLPSVSTPEDES